MEDMVEEGEREGQGTEGRMRRRWERGEKGERVQKGEMEGHLQRWHLIQHNLSHSGYYTVTQPSMLGLFLFHFLSLSIPSPLTFHLYKLNLLSSFLFLPFYCYYMQLRIYDLWWFNFLQYHVIVIMELQSLLSYHNLPRHFSCLGHFSSHFGSTALVFLSLYLYRQSPHLRMRFALSYFCFESVHIIQRQLCLISHNKRLLIQKKYN